MKIESFERDAPLDDIAATLRRDGVVIIDSLMADQRMKELSELCDGILAPRDYSEVEFFGGRMRGATRLFARGPEFTELLLDPVQLAIADDILLPSCNAYQLHIGACTEIAQGGKDQILHRADDIFEPHLPYEPGDRSRILSFMWAGSDFTATNGATRIAPGSHLWERERRATEADVVPAVMPRGSVVAWLGGTIHGLGINHDAEPRKSIFMSFSLGWLRQEENQYLAVPPEVAEKLPLRAQQLLGYRAFGSALGFVEGRDPECLLREGRTISERPLGNVYGEQG